MTSKADNGRISWVHDPRLGIYCSLSHNEGIPDWQLWKDNGGWRLKGRALMQSIFFNHLADAKAYANQAEAEMEAL